MPVATARAANPAPLVEIARHCVIPDDVAFTRYYELIAPELPGMGITLDQWQQDIWEIALGLRSDGSLCCDVMGVTLSIARQAGKTWGVMVGLIAICLARPGTTVVWSSHHDRTSSETLAKIAGIVEKPAIRPKMRAQHPVVNTDDNRGVHFANGSRILFGARSAGFGRGFSEVDIQVYDECQNIKPGSLTDMLAAMNVSEIGLAFFMGTPPRPQETRLGVDAAFKRRRNRAIEPKKRRPFKGVYVEFSADAPVDRESIPDLDAPEFWERLSIANPSYGYRVGRSAIERLVENMSPEDVYREVMGIWDETNKVTSPIDAAAWAANADGGPSLKVKPTALGVDMNHARKVSIGACWLEVESAHVEEVWAGFDERDAIEWIVRAAGRRMPVMIDSESPANSMIPTLKARGVKALTGSAADMAKGCGLVKSETEARTLTHADQKSLNDARTGARERKIGKAGGWGYDRSSPTVEIQPLVAVTLARVAASIQGPKKHDPMAGKVVASSW